MLELRDAAQGFGIDLIGVKLAMTHRSLDRPGIVFVKRGSAGHFLIARPVGTSGKLVQLLDGVQPPEIMDVAELEMLPGWTGLALLPERTNWIKVVAATLTLGSSSIVVVWLGVAARRRRVKQQPA